MVVESMVPGMLLVPVLPLVILLGAVAACAFFGGVLLGEQAQRGLPVGREKKGEGRVN